MRMHRQGFLKCTTAMAAIHGLPMAPILAAPRATKYAYLGRTEDYAEFRLIEPGLTITKLESWTQGAFGVVRITTNDGREGTDGKVKLPDGPGWGIKINPAWIEKAVYLKSEKSA